MCVRLTAQLAVVEDATAAGVAPDAIAFGDDERMLGARVALTSSDRRCFMDSDRILASREAPERCTSFVPLTESAPTRRTRAEPWRPQRQAENNHWASQRRRTTAPREWVALTMGDHMKWRLTFDVRGTRRRRRCGRSEQSCPAVVCPLDGRVSRHARRSTEVCGNVLQATNDLSATLRPTID